MMSELPNVVHIIGGCLMTSNGKKNDPDLDGVWVALIKEALSLGISTEEIREFFKNNKVNNEKVKCLLK
jgi:Anti-repressor SinI